MSDAGTVCSRTSDEELPTVRWPTKSGSVHARSLHDCILQRCARWQTGPLIVSLLMGVCLGVCLRAAALRALEPADEHVLGLRAALCVRIISEQRHAELGQPFPFPCMVFEFCDSESKNLDYLPTLEATPRAAWGGRSCPKECSVVSLLFASGSSVKKLGLWCSVDSKYRQESVSLQHSLPS
eukprot:2126531-Rhodomonas_salina.1